MRSYRTRWDFVRPYVEGKKVLDVGPAELVGTIHRYKEERWLHKKMASVATEVIGLEINEEQVGALRNMGYDIRLGDAEAFALSETFDVIVAGELIEHLSNPGEFLKCARRHLRPNGILLLTTPNRYGALAFLKLLRRNRVPSYDKPIAKHVTFFDEDSIRSLLTRYNFVDIVVSYYETVGAPPKHFKIKLLNAFLRRYRPMLLPGLLVSAHARGDETTTS
jgi:2-polyprenyl-3-methyl-5-hydroxy-6-metoxy-1,4-benzoquinol methylase